MNTPGNIQEKINPYKRKQFVSKEMLFEIPLFVLLIGINSFPWDKSNAAELIGATIGRAFIPAAIGVLISYIVNKKSEKSRRILYAYLIAIGLSILFVLVPFLDEKKETKWNRIKSIDGKYSILFPGNPKDDVQTVDNPVFGKVNVVSKTFEFGNEGNGIAYMDLPSQINNLSEENLRIILLSVRDSTTGGVNGKLLGSSYFKYKNYPGISFNAELSLGKDRIETSYFGKIILIKNRVYSIFDFAPKAKTTKDEIDKYLNSFESNY